MSSSVTEPFGTAKEESWVNVSRSCFANGAVGDEIEDGDEVVILESMKMEIPVESEDDGVVKEIKCEEGQSVTEGDVLIVLE